MKPVAAALVALALPASTLAALEVSLSVVLRAPPWDPLHPDYGVKPRITVTVAR